MALGTIVQVIGERYKWRVCGKCDGVFILERVITPNVTITAAEADLIIVGRG